MIQQTRLFIAGLPGNLRRITTQADFIPEIDGLRFLAIFPVILHHYSERVARAFAPQTDAEKSMVDFFSHGHIGVYIFFAVSGFILAMPFGKEKLEGGKTVSLKKYYWRRLTRLEPPYFIAMTGLFLVLVLMMNESFRELLPHYFASLLYLHRVIYNDWTPINPPAWTLEVEVMFYLVAPFIARGYFKIGRPLVRRLVLIGIIVFKVVLLNTTQLFDGLFLTIAYLIEFFLVGILLADFYLTDIKKSSVKNNSAFDLISIVSIVLLFTTWTWGKNLDFKFVFLTALFFVVYSSFQSRIMNKFFRNGWITAIGGMCYSIYLLHLAYAEMYVAVLKKLGIFSTYTNNFYFGFILFLPSLFVVTTIFFLLVEKPCMDPEWPQKLKRFLTGKRQVSNA